MDPSRFARFDAELWNSRGQGLKKTDGSTILRDAEDSGKRSR
jgi:hypothetical protein